MQGLWRSVLEFLGLEEDVEHTTYIVVSSTDGFATGSVVGEFEDNLFPELDNGDYRVYDQYGCHDDGLSVTTTDLVETPFGLEARSHCCKGMDKCPIRWERRVVEFPVGAWAAHDGATEFYCSDRQWMMVVEGCNDGVIRVSRDSSQVMQTDTVQLQITGSAELGSDYLVSPEEIVMEPGVLTRLCCCKSRTMGCSRVLRMC